jgi:thermitase
MRARPDRLLSFFASIALSAAIVVPSGTVSAVAAIAATRTALPASASTNAPETGYPSTRSVVDWSISRSAADAPLVLDPLAPSVPGELVVVLDSSIVATSAERALEARGATVERTKGDSASLLVKTPTGVSDPIFTETAEGAPGVAWVQPNYVYRAAYTPTDPRYPQQWGLPKIGAPAAWDVTRGRSTVLVAVVDTGVDYTHPDLASRVDTANDYDFINSDTDAMDDNGHGTHVSGIIAAVMDNGIGGVGVAPECRVLPVKVLDSEGSGDTFQVAAGIRYAADSGAKVINMSLAGSSDPSMSSAVAYAQEKGCVVVAAAGNDGSSGGAGYPARYPDVVGVGALDSSNNRAYFSNYGTGVDIAAPGVNILSTILGGSYGNMSGTSMAAPFVSGVAALVLSANPGFEGNPNAVIDRVLDAATPLDVSLGMGRGVVQAALAVDGVGPVSRFAVSPASPNGANGWYTNPSVAATISVEETNSGLHSLTVNGSDVSADLIFGLPPNPSLYPVPTPVQGVNTYTFFGTDNGGNVESPAKTAQVKLDSVLPTCNLSVSSNGPTKLPITASITAGDASPGSGVDHVQYVFLPRGSSPSGDTVWKSVAGSSATTSAPEGRLTVFARSFDVAGNVSATQQADVFVDLTAPVTTLVTIPASSTGAAGSWLHAPPMTLNVVDAGPNTTTLYSWNTTNTIATAGSTPVVPTGAGVQTLRYLSVDAAGNREATKTATFVVQDQQSYTLHYTAATGGTISGTADQAVAYGGSGTAVTAVQATGYHFVAWSDGILTAARTDTNVTADHTISATFSALPPATFTITPSAGAHGSISPSTPQTVASGADLAFTIKPDIGYRVASVLVGGVSVGAVTSYTFNNVTANGTISATFASTLTRTTIGIVANHSSVPRGHPVYFHGVISPNRTSTHVGFYMRKAGSTTWKLVSTRHTFSGHHWSYPSYHPSTRGTYYFQVRLSATSKYASSTIKVVWR